MSTFYRLSFRVGSSEVRLDEVAKTDIRSNPGAYVEVDREERSFYIVPKEGKPFRSNEHAATTFALDMLSAEDKARHEMMLAVASRNAARRDDSFAASPLEGVEFPTCADLLRKFECDFRVVAKNAGYFEPMVPGKSDATWHLSPGFRMTVREDNGVTLHASTDAYQIVQSVDALNLLDGFAKKRGILYRYAWKSIESQRVRAVGAERGKNVDIEGRRVGIRFDLDGVRGAFDGRISAGGTLVTSHDGSTAIKATACLYFAGVTIFHTNVRSWRHTSKVEARLDDSKDALEYLVRAARALVRDAEACATVSSEEACDVVLRAVAPDLFAAVPDTLDEVKRAELVKARATKLVECRKRLHAAAATWRRNAGETNIGGFAYVLAAPHFASNRAVGVESYFDGLARERMTTALLAVARHAGMVEAGIVPDAA